MEHKKADCPTALRQKEGDSTAGTYAACGCGTIDACSHGWTGGDGCLAVRLTTYVELQLGLVEYFGTTVIGLLYLS